jgi:hypothetical protein
MCKSSSRSRACGSKKLNINIKLNFWYSVLSSAAYSLAFGQFCSIYIQKMPMGSDEQVGFVSATTGLTQMVFAVPVGIYVDSFSRSSVIKASTFFGTKT